MGRAGFLAGASADAVAKLAADRGDRVDTVNFGFSWGWGGGNGGRVRPQDKTLAFQFGCGDICSISGS
jgi:hypothetical protein